MKSARNEYRTTQNAGRAVMDTQCRKHSTELWWIRQRPRLLALAAKRSPAYVYDLETVRNKAFSLTELKQINRIFFSVKANHHPDVLRKLYSSGLGFECVSAGELVHVLHLFDRIDPEKLLFTPNFAPREEYALSLDSGVATTLDGLYPLQAWPELFKGRPIFLRLDLGYGIGHHRHVRTAGEESKFGIPLSRLEEAQRLCRNVGASVIGLHSHAGSGILDSENWRRIGEQLAESATRFPQVRVLNVGGGLGIPDDPGTQGLDLPALDTALGHAKRLRPDCEVWMEPGRYLVAEAGVLLARVTQIKEKGAKRYIGIDTGMNSLIRPALYGAQHPVVNLSRMNEAPCQTADLVGPICETGDVLAHAQPFTQTGEGDVILIANAGAYGSVMSSSYNLRPPAVEIVVGQ